MKCTSSIRIEYCDNLSKKQIIAIYDTIIKQVSECVIDTENPYFYFNSIEKAGNKSVNSLKEFTENYSPHFDYIDFTMTITFKPEINGNVPVVLVTHMISAKFIMINVGLDTQPRADTLAEDIIAEVKNILFAKISIPTVQIQASDAQIKYQESKDAKECNIENEKEQRQGIFEKHKFWIGIAIGAAPTAADIILRLFGK